MHFQDVKQACYLARKKYPVKIHLFRAANRGFSFITDRDQGWGQVASGGIEITDIPGKHTSVLEDPHAAVLAEKIKEVIDKIK